MPAPGDLPVDKSPEAFRTISEVADDLDLPQHVLRFWETRFAQIRPIKRGGGRRYYRPDDVELLKGIRHLLYGEGYTIRGVQRILKEQGIRSVTALAGAAPAGPAPAAALHPATTGQAADATEEETDADDVALAGTQADTPLPARAGPIAPPVRQPAMAPVPAPARPAALAPASTDPVLSRDDVRRLQAALFDLGECRRLLSGN
jgi:DNA-binding transcriptional MerR regulator